MRFGRSADGRSGWGKWLAEDEEHGLQIYYSSLLDEVLLHKMSEIRYAR